MNFYFIIFITIFNIKISISILQINHRLAESPQESVMLKLIVPVHQQLDLQLILLDVTSTLLNSSHTLFYPNSPLCYLPTLLHHLGDAVQGQSVPIIQSNSSMPRQCKLLRHLLLMSRIMIFLLIQEQIHLLWSTPVNLQLPYIRINLKLRKDSNGVFLQAHCSLNVPSSPRGREWIF